MVRAPAYGSTCRRLKTLSSACQKRRQQDTFPVPTCILTRDLSFITQSFAQRFSHLRELVWRFYQGSAATFDQGQSSSMAEGHLPTLGKAVLFTYQVYSFRREAGTPT